MRGNACGGWEGGVRCAGCAAWGETGAPCSSLVEAFIMWYAVQEVRFACEGRLLCARFPGPESGWHDGTVCAE